MEAASEPHSLGPGTRLCLHTQAEDRLPLRWLVLVTGSRGAAQRPARVQPFPARGNTACVPAWAGGCREQWGAHSPGPGAHGQPARAGGACLGMGCPGNPQSLGPCVLAGRVGWLGESWRAGQMAVSPLPPHAGPESGGCCSEHFAERYPSSPPHRPGPGQPPVPAGGTSLTTDRTPVGLQLALSV